jgi:tRNA(Ile)-lysidine synthase
LLIRPLLAIPRAEVEDYCAAHGLEPRFDRSNEDTTFFRNRLRHELLPILETYNPAIREVLAHTAAVLAGDHEVLRGAVEEAWRNVILSGSRSQPGPHGQESDVQFGLSAWRALPLGLQRATIRAAIHRLRWTLRNINWEHVERAVWLAREGGTGQAATLAAGLELQIGYDSLRITEEGAPWPPQPDVPQVAGPLALDAPGVTEVGGGWQVEARRLQRDVLPADFAANADPWTAFLDAAVVGQDLSLRHRQPGDRFQPQGLGGHSTALNEFMIDAKIARDARAAWPLLIGQGGIAWVCGLRVDERATVGNETRDVWEVRFSRQVDK